MTTTVPIDITRAQAIPGWMRDTELRWLATAAQRCQTIVEFGSYRGRSTRALADHCPGTVWAFDPWDDTYPNDDGSQAKWFKPGAWAAFQQHLADHIATGRVRPVRASSASLYPTPTSWETLVEACPDVDGLAPGEVDLVFVDGDHRVEACRRDIDIALAWLRKGGILAGHDYGHPHWPGVQQAVDELGAAVQVVESIWWLEV